MKQILALFSFAILLAACASNKDPMAPLRDPKNLLSEEEEDEDGLVVHKPKAQESEGSHADTDTAAACAKLDGTFVKQNTRRGKNLVSLTFATSVENGITSYQRDGGVVIKADGKAYDVADTKVQLTCKKEGLEEMSKPATGEPSTILYALKNEKTLVVTGKGPLASAVFLGEYAKQ